jgi:acyl-CoA synthetase (AMP-forming)/AMP-acid ligase II/thioesterase domain-containing protein/acyl carrier protein
MTSTLNNNKFQDFSNISKPKAIAHGEKILIPENVTINVIEALQNLLKEYPQGKFIYISGKEEQQEQTYQESWQRANQILAYLQSKGLNSGTKVILQLDNTLDFISCFWCCLLGGLIPILTPIVFNSISSHQKRNVLRQIFKDCNSPFIITKNKFKAEVKELLDLDQEPKIITIDKLNLEENQAIYYPQKPENLAYFLLTSGTTGKPKLITINHKTLLYRLFPPMKQSADSQDDNINTVNLFPIEHISGNLFTVPNGKVKIHLEMNTFIKNPLILLDTLEKYQATPAMITNFIASLIIDAIEQSPHKTWNLASVKIMGMGGEMINYKISKLFLNTLAKYGVNPNAIKPGYGMSECGLAVRATDFVLKTSADGSTFVEAGKPTPGHSVRIVDDQNQILQENQIGRIQLTGVTMTSGYYNNPEANHNLFTPDGWINTGDLGFIDNGCLTITGREKEIIIINASNYSSSVIEIITEQVEGVSKGYTVACGVRNHNSITEELAIFFHSSLTDSQKLTTLCQQIRILIVKELGINPTYLIPVKKEQIPRTATGKIQRLKLKQKFEQGDFQYLVKSVQKNLQQDLVNNFIAPTNDIEIKLAKIWQEVLEIQEIGINDNFFALGGNSLFATQIVSKLADKLKINIPVNILFEKPNIKDLVAYLNKQLDSSSNNKSLNDSCVVMINDNGDKCPLYFINSTKVAYDLQPYLGNNQPLYSLNIFGLTTRINKPFTQLTISDLATYIIKDLLEFKSEDKYQLIGYCQDGPLTLEIAQQLKKLGKKIELLCLVDVSFDHEVPNGNKKQSNKFFNRLQMIKDFKFIYIQPRIKYYLSKIAKIANKFNFGHNINQSREDKELQAKITLDQKLYENYYQLLKNYKPSAYNGEIVSIQSKEFSLVVSPTLKLIAKQGLKSEVINTTHHSLFERHIHLFVETLKKYL